MLVGDPQLARELMPAATLAAAHADFMGLPGGPDFSTETQRLFDAVARQCTTNGYRVVRIPVVPAHDRRTYLTYVNVVLDRAGDQRVVYLPFYSGAEALNGAARVVWESLRYQVKPVDCTTVYPHFGCLHCLVNVLQRGSPLAPADGERVQ